MQCKNHSTVSAVDRCSGCAEAFCSNCLVTVNGQKYCAACKVMAIKVRPQIEEGDTPCELAGQALTYAIIGLFCLGIIMGPLAVGKALEARKMIREDPRLTGEAKANVALLLGVIALVSWGVGMIARFMKK